MPHQEVDDKPTAGRGQDRRLDMDLLSVLGVAAADSLQRPDFPDNGGAKNAIATGHKAHAATAGLWGHSLIEFTGVRFVSES